MDRIEKLRQVTFDESIYGIEYFYLFHKAYVALSDRPEWERFTEAFFYMFDNLTPCIGDGELIVGNRNYQLPPEQQADWEENYKKDVRDRCYMIGHDSHMAVDLELLLAQGTNGILARIDGYLADCQDPEKIIFYKSCRRCLEAVNRHAERYADAALEQSKKTEDPQRKAELLRIGEICRKVPANPAETFYEAVQSVHFINYCLTLNPRRDCVQQFQYGRPDRYLLPYYEKDIREGRLTKEYAQLLLDCLGIQINMNLPNGFTCGYMVGGRDAKGNIVANEVTELCLQVIDDIRLVFPAVGFCHAEGMPEKYVDMAMKPILNGRSHPAFFSDEVVTKGMLRYGVPPEEACNYIHSTCVEITPIGASNSWPGKYVLAMTQRLFDCLDREYDSIDGLIAAYLEKLDIQIADSYKAHLQWRAKRKEIARNPLLSCFVNDCLARGMDIEEGGARYNWDMPSFVGMANLVDSVYAIEKLVFQEKRLTLRQFKEILDSDYADNEPLRQYIKTRLPKYGNDVDEIDRLFGLFTEHILQECAKYQGPYSHQDHIPGMFCWILHELYGRATPATPDGRKAGLPLSDSAGASQGSEVCGPTAAILSSTKWAHDGYIGGIAVNMKFSRAFLGANAGETLKTLIKTYLARGGFELQINVVDTETLRAAQKDPEHYRDLVVRIGGYSDYFVKLVPELQEEVISRTVYNV